MKLFNGDCLEVMKELPNNSIDFILTDPPYGKTQNNWDKIIPSDLMWKQIKRIRKDNTAIALFGIEPFSSYLRLSNIKEYKYDWVWNKVLHSNPFLAKIQPLRVLENIHIFYKSQPNYNPIKVPSYPKQDRGNKTKKHNSSNFGISILYSGADKDELKYPTNLLTFRKSDRHNINNHPTEKQVDLLEYLIKTYTLENETVLDFTMGSGSTGVACKNTSRDFIGIELDREYYETATTRIKKASES